MLRRLKEELRAREGDAAASSAADGKSTTNNSIYSSSSANRPKGSPTNTADEAIRPSAESTGADFDDSDDPTLFPAAVASETDNKRQRLESEDDGDGKAEEEEEDLLRKELEKVKKERERAKTSSSSTASLFLPDPNGGEGGDTTIKKKWNEDVIFRASSNAASVFEAKKKEFVNDSTHSEFHKRFVKKYVR